MAKVSSGPGSPSLRLDLERPQRHRIELVTSSRGCLPCLL
jgi:hypothetical protein